MKSQASAHWEGSPKDGTGTISTATGVLKDSPYSSKARFEGGTQQTTPEELIAAAHAGCYTMALGFALMRAGIDQKSISTDAEVEVILGEKGANITAIKLKTTVVAPGADAAKIKEAAEGAKVGCPVSKALAGVPSITLEVETKV
jgi:osmotically inducible protein OsmC